MFFFPRSLIELFLWTLFIPKKYIAEHGHLHYKPQKCQPFFVEDPIFLEEISSCPSTHQCCNSRLIFEVLVCQGSVVCFGADDYGQSNTEISQKNARMVTVVVRCCQILLSLRIWWCFFLHGNLFDSLRFWSIYKLGRCLPCSFGVCYVSHHILASSDVPAKAWKMCQRAVWSGEAGLFRLVIKWSTWIRWSFGPRVLNPSQTLWANNRNKFHIRFPWCKLSWRLNLPPFAHCPLLEETDQLG